MKDYQQVLDYLYGTLPMFQRVGAPAYRNDLSNTVALCDMLGNPQTRFKSIHVAGTNGKGSTSHMLAAVLHTAGYKTGLYTSPHLKEFTERIRINGKEVEKSFVVDFVRRTKDMLEQRELSFFEMTVGMAFDYFDTEKVDVAVIEVGMGGRLDSTNVITPEVSLITNISFDHQQFLGDTLSKIAFEKAGIIKAGVPVIVSERQEEVEDVFITRASQLNATLTFASERIQLQPGDNGFDVYQNGELWLEGLAPGLKGTYQTRNIPGVLASVLSLREKGYRIPDTAVLQGVAGVVELTGLKGRWQILNQRPLTVCDTGHNLAGIAEIMGQIRATPHRDLHMIVGFVNDKDISGILRLLPKHATYYFTQSHIPRSVDAVSLEREAARAGLEGTVVVNVNEAIRQATDAAHLDDLIFVGGSTFVVAEIEGL
ncbi:MAG: folylpolyglutamate synthase/dihydrofolate synthase family protein [Cytophagales bacterium]|nr:folylpolyglutamate synthase/dihydrofolate synthase family protein [Cytophagales bacterium]